MTTLVVGIICFFVGGFAGVLVISICHAAKQVPDLDDFGRMATGKE